MKLPKTLWEALDQGWQISGSDTMCSADERTQWGNLVLERGKTDDGYAAENLDVPFVGAFAFGKPKNYERYKKKKTAAKAI